MSTDSSESRLHQTLMGWQHVLVMYAGTITVPLIVGSALQLSKEDVAFLINADLCVAGLITIIQSLGFGRLGIRLPVMMGVTFAAVGPIIAIGQNPSFGLPGVYGAVIVAGLFAMLIAPLIGRLTRFFPPLVTGTIICLIGLSLLKVGINWCAGGQPTVSVLMDGQMIERVNPEYGRLDKLAIAAFVLMIILVIQRFGQGLVKNLSVLIGLLLGTVLSATLGRVSLQGLNEVAWFGLTMPFHFGMPTFHLVPILSLCLVMIIVLSESLGIFLAIGTIVDRKISSAEITAGLRADGFGTFIGGIFNTFPYTSFSQNVGLLSVTGVRTRQVTAIGGLILFGLALFPKFAHIAASIPTYVLGGAGLVMFGSVAATGIRILGTVDYARDKHSLIVLATSLSVGMIPTLSPQFFQHMPSWADSITHSGIILGSLTAIGLNFCLQPPQLDNADNPNRLNESGSATASCDTLVP